MSRTIDIPHSSVSQKNVIISSGSRVDGKSLVIDGDIDYVERFAPEIMDGNDTMSALYGTERDEVETLHDEIHETINNTFLQTMGVKGLQMWERILGIESAAAMDLNSRRSFVLMKRLFAPPITRLNFMKILNSVWGEGNYYFSINPNEFRVVIDIVTNNPRLYLKFQKYIRNLAPANMELIFSVQYTYLYLNHLYTYGDMTALTYGELSRYN